MTERGEVRVVYAVLLFLRGLPAWCLACFAGVSTSKLLMVGYLLAMGGRASVVEALAARGLPAETLEAAAVSWVVTAGVLWWAALRQRREHGGWNGAAGASA